MLQPLKPQTSFTPSMPPVQMLAPLSDDPIRITAARRQCYRQFTRIRIWWPQFWWEKNGLNQHSTQAHLSDLHCPQFFSPPSDIHVNSSDARSLQSVQAQITRSPSLDHYSHNHMRLMPPTLTHHSEETGNQESRWSTFISRFELMRFLRQIKWV